MGLSESDTRAKLIDPAIHQRGWTEDLIRREETAGAIEIGTGGPRRRPKGRVDYVLRVKVTLDSQPVAVALIEAKAEHQPPTQHTVCNRPSSTPPASGSMSPLCSPAMAICSSSSTASPA